MKYVSYLRASTNRQGRSGLGLEAQRAAVAGYLGGRSLVAEVAEVESGKRPTGQSSRRPSPSVEPIGQR